MTVFTVSPFWKDIRPSTRSIDPVAFALALALGPLFITVCSGFLLIPIVALVLGWPVFLLLGVPTLLWWMLRYEPSPRALARLAFKVDVLLLIAGVFVNYLTSNDFMLSFAVLGLFFAPAWAAAFAKYYLRFRREFYAPRHRENTLIDLKEGDI